MSGRWAVWFAPFSQRWAAGRQDQWGDAAPEVRFDTWREAFDYADRMARGER